MAGLGKGKFLNRQHIVYTVIEYQTKSTQNTPGRLYGSAYLQEGMSVYYEALIESFFALWDLTHACPCCLSALMLVISLVNICLYYGSLTSAFFCDMSVATKPAVFVLMGILLCQGQ